MYRYEHIEKGGGGNSQLTIHNSQLMGGGGNSPFTIHNSQFTIKGGRGHSQFTIKIGQGGSIRVVILTLFHLEKKIHHKMRKIAIAIIIL